jgi:DNA-binding NarL/FixJ family response regulator
MLVLDEPVLYAVQTVLEQSGSEAIAKETRNDLFVSLERGQADVLLIDLDHHEANRPRLIEDLTSRHPEIPVVALTANDDPDRIQAAMRDGARGYFLQGLEISELPGLLALVTSR